MKKVEKRNISAEVDKNIDLLIFSTSFEDRCLSLIECIELDSVKTAIVFNYKNNYDKSELNLNKIKGLLDGKINWQQKTILPNSPIENCDTFISVLDELPANANVLVDVSTFTRENILILIRLFKSKYSELNVNYCYTPSCRYSISEDDSLETIKQNLWLSKGVDDIRSILGYPGVFSPVKKVLLIILVGFEYERAQILIDNYEPNLLVIGKASKDESITDRLSEINEINFNNLQNVNADVDTFEFSCKDIVKTKNALMTVYDKYKDEYNIVISPMNNKLSTIAVASFALTHPDIQICYATTNQYNIEGYSQSCDYFYLIDSIEI